MTESTICPNCKSNERIYDSEPGFDGQGGYYSHCSACFDLFAAAPYCHHAACSGRICGSRTALVNGPAAAKGEAAVYACPNCGDSATAVAWATSNGTETALRDLARRADGDLDLVGVRTASATRDLDAAHPVRRAYARAYVDTATAQDRELIG